MLENVGGHENATNDKAIKIAQQINPKIVIPTHSAVEYLQSIPKDWKATYSNNKAVTIPRNEPRRRRRCCSWARMARSTGTT